MPKIFSDLDKPTTFEEKCEKFMMISVMLAAPLLIFSALILITIVMLKELAIL